MSRQSPLHRLPPYDGSRSVYRAAKGTHDKRHLGYRTERDGKSLGHDGSRHDTLDAPFFSFGRMTPLSRPDTSPIYLMVSSHLDPTGAVPWSKNPDFYVSIAPQSPNRGQIEKVENNNLISVITGA